MDYGKQALKLHRKLAGKIQISSKVKISSKATLSTIYTPGVGAVASVIAKEKQEVWKLTGRRNTVAIVSDGTAILGLGNIGPEAGLPVMEGKAALFAEFGKVNAYPLCINTCSPDEVVNFVKTIAPSFGGINLEDIAAPECFEIEEKLSSPAGELGIPVFHDDQDGAAIVVLAGLVNTMRVLDRKMHKQRIVIMGAGASASATAWLLLGREKWHPGKKISNLFFDTPLDVILVDSKGIIDERRPDLSSWKKMLASVTNREKRHGGINDAFGGTDIFVGLSSGGKITPRQIAQMNKNPIIFALSNPTPEIMPSQAEKAKVALIATGRSDFPNQINNALVFPGFFRGLLDAQAKKVTPEVKIAAAKAIAEAVRPTRNAILPSVLDRKVHQMVSQAVRKQLVGKFYNLMV